MNIQTKPQDIVAYVGENPVACFTDDKAYSEFYERVKAEVTAHEPDVSTAKGRSEIASIAYKVTRSKTAIDAAGKKLNEEARRQIGIVDAQRRKIREELDALADEVRKPLTEWEEAEKRRQEAVRQVFEQVEAMSVVTVDDTPATVAERIAHLDALEVDEDVFGDRFAEANDAIHSAWQSLAAAKERLEKQEADAAELARLRAEQEERERVDREAREAEEAERIATEREDRLADQIIEYIKEVRAGRIGGQPYPYGILLRELEIKIPLDEYAPRHHARIEEAKREAHEFLTAQMERDAAKAAEREERERQAAIERTRREEEARAADREHRSRIMAEAKAALMAQGAGEGTARKIVLAIVAGEVPHVTLKF